MEQKKIIQVQLDSDTVLLFQKIDMERQSRKEIIEDIFLYNLEIQSEQFVTYQKEYYEYYQAFFMLKQDLEDTVIKPRIPKDKEYTWNLNYNTNELTIIYSL